MKIESMLENDHNKYSLTIKHTLWAQERPRTSQQSTRKLAKFKDIMQAKQIRKKKESVREIISKLAITYLHHGDC